VLRINILAICVLTISGCMQLPPLMAPRHAPVDDQDQPAEERIDAPGKKVDGVAPGAGSAAVGRKTLPLTEPKKKRRRPDIFTSNEYGSAGVRYGTVQGIRFQNGTRGELDGMRYTSGSFHCDVDFPRGPRFSLDVTAFESEFGIFLAYEEGLELTDVRSRFTMADLLFTPARYVSRTHEIYCEVGFRYVHFTVDYDWYDTPWVNRFHSEDTIEGLLPLAGGGVVFNISRGYIAFHGRCFAGIGLDAYAAGIEGAFVLWPGRRFTGSIGWRVEKLGLEDGGNSRRMAMLMSGPIFELGFRV
jgi:hypothetical protein